MIVSRIIGGLGNQLFQYSFGYAVSRGLGVPLYLETNSFANYPLRSYRLDHFELEAQILPSQESAIETASKEGYTLSLHGLKTVFERDLPDPLNVSAIHDDSFLIGYWQLHSPVQPLEAELRRQFVRFDRLSVANQQLLDRINDSPSVAIHVRRGDYVQDRKTRRIHGPVGPGYYAEAVSTLLQNFEGVQAFVFSDEPSWAKSNLSFGCPSEFVFHNGPDQDWEELMVMSACNHFIIANSTFSWWGAFLGSCPDKRVYCPEPWYADPNKSAKGLLPPDWIKIGAKRSESRGILDRFLGKIGAR